MADPTIRERLRELAARSWNDEMSDLEWGHLKAQRAEFGVAVRDLIPAIESELDTLERRAIAAEKRLYVLTRLVQIAHDEMPERLNNATRVNVNEAAAYADPLRGHSSGLTRDLEAEFEARAALEASRGSA